MGYGALIRQQRQAQGWTQRQLAEATGCTDGYVAHIENEVKQPSLNLCMEFARVLQMSASEQQRLLDAVEAAQRQRADQRIRTRGARVRGALRTHGGARSTPSEPKPDDLDAERIAQDLASNPDLRTAYHHLRTAMANPRLRDTVLTALRALARESDTS